MVKCNNIPPRQETLVKGTASPSGQPAARKAFGSFFRASLLGLAIVCNLAVGCSQQPAKPAQGLCRFAKSAEVRITEVRPRFWDSSSFAGDNYGICNVSRRVILKYDEDAAPHVNGRWSAAAGSTKVLNAGEAMVFEGLKVTFEGFRVGTSPCPVYKEETFGIALRIHDGPDYGGFTIPQPCTPSDPDSYAEVVLKKGEERTTHYFILAKEAPGALGSAEIIVKKAPLF